MDDEEELGREQGKALGLSNFDGWLGEWGWFGWTGRGIRLGGE